MKAAVKLIGAPEVDVVPRASRGTGIALTISYDSSRLVARIAVREAETCSSICPNPVIAALSKRVVCGNDDIVPLADSDKHRGVLVRRDWDKVGASNLKGVVVD